MRLYAQVSGAFFSFIAVAQLLRAVMRVPVQAADVTIPVWASYCAFVFLGAFAVWAFNMAKRAA
jgi:hypothetical protein